MTSFREMREKYLKHPYHYVEWEKYKEEWFLTANLEAYCLARLEQTELSRRVRDTRHFISPLVKGDDWIRGSLFIWDQTYPDSKHPSDLLLIPHGPDIPTQWRDHGFQGNTWTLINLIDGRIRDQKFFHQGRGRKLSLEEANKVMEEILGVTRKEWMEKQDWEKVRARCDIENELSRRGYENYKAWDKKRMEAYDKKKAEEEKAAKENPAPNPATQQLQLESADDYEFDDGFFDYSIDLSKE